MKRAAIATVRFGGHLAMKPFEKRAMRSSVLQGAPIFIIGAPRSGTSLLYELMITRFRFAYMSNAAHRFFQTPITATRLFRSAITGWQGNFTSKFGHIDGWGAPNEGGWIWQRWLPDSDWRDGKDLSETTISELQQLVAGLSQSLDAPFLNKNVMHSNRLQLMNRIWPNALFVEVQRDVLDNARSIVRAERTSGGPEKHGDDWWSVRPKLAAQYAGRKDTIRAVAQTAGVAQDIARDASCIGDNRVLRVQYTQLCQEPAETMRVIEQFLSGHGVPTASRLAVPETFEVRPSKLLSPEDEASMAAALEDL